MPSSRTPNFASTRPYALLTKHCASTCPTRYLVPLCFYFFSCPIHAITMPMSFPCMPQSKLVCHPTYLSHVTMHLNGHVHTLPTRVLVSYSPTLSSIPYVFSVLHPCSSARGPLRPCTLHMYLCFCPAFTLSLAMPSFGLLSSPTCQPSTPICLKLSRV